MNVKEFFDNLFSRYLLYHLLGMLVTITVLCLCIGFGLDIYTHHGEIIEVPNLHGMSYEKACRLLEEKGLIVEVGDSGYNKKLPANSILAQTPDPGLFVKEGRIVYVTVNSPSSPTFAIPDIIDNASVREAQAKLTAMGFKLNAPQLVEGEKDWVYGILCNGRRVSNGDRVSIESSLTLMVGKGTQEYLDMMGVGDEYSTATENGEGEVDEFVEVTEAPTAP